MNLTVSKAVTLVNSEVEYWIKVIQIETMLLFKHLLQLAFIDYLNNINKI